MAGAPLGFTQDGCKIGVMALLKYNFERLNIQILLVGQCCNSFWIPKVQIDNEKQKMMQISQKKNWYCLPQSVPQGQALHPGGHSKTTWT